MQVNVQLLEREIANAGLNTEGFAKSIGMDRATYYRKRKSGFESFTIGQMHKTVETLNLSGDKACEIFLFKNSQ